MSQYRRILVIASARLQRTPALDRGIELALATGAHLDLVLFDYHLGIAAMSALQPAAMLFAKTRYLAAGDGWLVDAAAYAADRGLKVKTQLIWGEPILDHIVDHVLHESYDLVVKDVSPDPRVAHQRLSTLDRALARLCPASLLLVRKSLHKRPERIVAAVDPGRSDHNTVGLDERVVREALALGYQCDATVHLAHVLCGMPEGVAVGAWYSEELVAEAYEAMHNRQREDYLHFAETHNVHADCRHLLSGDPASELVHFATNNQVDVVVLGAIYRKGFKRLLLGSTAERVLEDACCDVLVVKPDDFNQTLAHHYRLESADELLQHQLGQPENAH